MFMAVEFAFSVIIPLIVGEFKFILEEPEIMTPSH